MEIINIIAIVTSPLVAVYVTTLLSKQSAKKADQKNLFSTLLVYQYMPADNNRTIALNMIPFVFSKNKKVLEQFYVYKKLHTELRHLIKSQNQIPIPEKFVALHDSYTRLLECISMSLGYNNDFSWDKIKDSIIPTSIIDNQGNQQWF